MFSQARTGTDTVPSHCHVLVVTLGLVLNKYAAYVVKLDKTVGMSSVNLRCQRYHDKPLKPRIYTLKNSLSQYVHCTYMHMHCSTVVACNKKALSTNTPQ